MHVNHSNKHIQTLKHNGFPPTDYAPLLYETQTHVAVLLFLFLKWLLIFFFSWKNRQQVLTSKDTPLMAGICHGCNKVEIHLGCVPWRTCLGFYVLIHSVIWPVRACVRLLTCLTLGLHWCFWTQLFCSETEELLKNPPPLSLCFLLFCHVRGLLLQQNAASLKEHDLLWL